MWTQIPKIVLVGAGAIFLGWTAIKSAVVGAFEDSPAVAASIAPGDPRVMLALAASEISQTRGAIGADTFEASRNALLSAPLSEVPFIIAGLASLMEGDRARAERLLTQARERNPRSRFSRLLLLDQYLRSGRTREAAQEMAVLSRLIPAAGKVLLPELVKFAEEPKTRSALATVLRENPLMRRRVLELLVSKGADPDVILNLAESSGARESGAQWQSSLIRSLVEEGEIARAYAVWGKVGGVATASKGVYDGDFAGRPGAPPFNWDLVVGKAGMAGRTGAGGLQIAYYGSASTQLASQLVMLEPGRYQLSMQAEGAADGEGGSLAWVIECNRNGSRLARLPIENVTYSPRTIGVAFTVPEGCPAQWLKLTGKPGSPPKEQLLTISNMEIRKAAQQ